MEEAISDPYIVCMVPTRGDRPQMLELCMKMMSRQILKPVDIVIVDDPPVDPNVKDITWRYRIGVNRIIEKHPNVELILFIEDDDWYSDHYIEVFYDAWNLYGRPDVFGIHETYYYHLGIRSYHHEVHYGRSSAFCTGVTKRVQSIEWPPDDFSFIDLKIWKDLQSSSSTFSCNPPIAVGMKGHMEGAFFGGIGHNPMWMGYNAHWDPDLEWLSKTIGREKVGWYMRKNRD